MRFVVWILPSPPTQKRMKKLVHYCQSLISRLKKNLENQSMAKLSVVHRGLKRDKTVKKFLKKRADIKEQLQKAFANGDEGTFDLQSLYKNYLVILLQCAHKSHGRAVVVHTQ